MVLVRLLCALALAVFALGVAASAAAAAAPTAVHALADDPVDSDFDGIPDDQDGCPFESGVPENYGCPYVGPVDSDGDGVTDDQDQCPIDPGSANYQGCAAPDTDGDGINDDTDACVYQPGPYDGCPLTDYDGDGVFDDGADQCPNEAGPPSNNGCPVPDSDGDGVTDDLDVCAGTASGAEIDGFGCSAAQRDSDSDGVTDDVDKCVDKAGPVDNDGCPLVAVEPASVVFDDRCGTSNDTATVPSKTGVVYYYAGKPVAAGRYVVKGTIKVEARAAKGYQLTGTKTWSKTFSAAACRVGKVLVTSPAKGLVRVVNQEKTELTLTSGRVSGRVGPNKTVTFAAPAGTYPYTATWKVDFSPAKGQVRVR